MQKLLLHTCCAPCMCYVYELLKERFDVSAYFYNPNIMPLREYDKRFSELASFGDLKRFRILSDDPDTREWVKRISPYRELGEKSERCRMCYRIRLEATFRRAEREKFTIVATSLSISPHKNSDWINEEGSALSSEYGISFYEADFKKKDGFKKSVEMSRELGFYRQDYCGCIYSKLERDPESGWSKMVREAKKRGITPADSAPPAELDTGTEIDLHHFHHADTENLVNEFLRIAVEKGYAKVRIIHGKGRSRIKQRVYAILENNPAVSGFHDDSYNWGATVVNLESVPHNKV